MTTITFVDAWRKNNPKFEADALALWEREGAMPDDNEAAARVKQLALLATKATTGRHHNGACARTRKAAAEVCVFSRHRFELSQATTSGY